MPTSDINVKKFLTYRLLVSCLSPIGLDFPASALIIAVHALRALATPSLGVSLRESLPPPKGEILQMRNAVLAVLAAVAGFALPCAGSTVDYVGLGSIGAGTAVLTGGTTAASVITLTSPLVSISGVSTKGTVTISTGTLMATSNANVFDFSGGTFTVMSGAATLYKGTLSAGAVTILGKNFFKITASGDGIAFTLRDRHGDVTTETTVTPELGTLTLLGTGLLGFGAAVRRKSAARRSRQSEA